MNVWAAGKLALEGQPGAAYDYARHYAVQAQALDYAEGQEATCFRLALSAVLHACRGTSSRCCRMEPRSRHGWR